MTPGFTLTELLVALALIAGLTAVAAPQLGAGVDEVRAWVWQRELLAGLERARIEALDQGETVTLCGGTPQAGCDAQGWDDGWILFRGEAASGQAPGPEQLLARGRGIGPGHRVVSDSGREDFRFQPDGWLSRIYGDTLRLCRDGAAVVAIRVASTGRARADNDQRGEPCD
nr:GspH/FimT family pseudopilin [Halorhodospira halophila]